jgi:hypothetical protein
MTAPPPPFTHAEYMAAPSAAAHRRYYAQFAEAYKPRVRAKFSPAALRRALARGRHLNTIPLAQWGALAWPMPPSVASLLRELGDFPTLGGAVFAAKEAARQIAEDAC